MNERYVYLNEMLCSIWLLSQDKIDGDKRNEDSGKEETCRMSFCFEITQINFMIVSPSLFEGKTLTKH